MPRPPNNPPAAHGIALPAFAALPPSLGVAVSASERRGEAAIYSASLGRPGQLRTSAVLAVAARVPETCKPKARSERERTKRGSRDLLAARVPETCKPKARRLPAVLAFAALPPSLGVAVSASERRGEAAIYSRLGSPRLASRRRGGSRPSWPFAALPPSLAVAARVPETCKPKARANEEGKPRFTRG